ncbi:MAG: hypothetical protein ACTSVF_04240, partial [Candidatus Asgardarchaeia archaeon]
SKIPISPVSTETPPLEVLKELVWEANPDSSIVAHMSMNPRIKMAFKHFCGGNEISSKLCTNWAYASLSKRGKSTLVSASGTAKYFENIAVKRGCLLKLPSHHSM